MNLDKIVAELKSERRRLDVAIAALEVLRSSSLSGRGWIPDPKPFKKYADTGRQKQAKRRLKVDELPAQKVVGAADMESAKARPGTVVAFPSKLVP